MSRTVTLRLDDDVYNQFRRLAEEDHRTLSNFIITSTKRYMVEHESVMDKILNNHYKILKEIKYIFADTCKVDLEDINFSKQIINDEIIRFQFECTYMYTKIGRLIYLNFDIFRDNPQILLFDSSSDLIPFDKTNNYKGLIDSILEEIKSKINKSS